MASVNEITTCASEPYPPAGGWVRAIAYDTPINHFTEQALLESLKDQTNAPLQVALSSALRRLDRRLALPTNTGKQGT